MDLNTQVERYKLEKVLVKGTVEHITPVTEQREEVEDGWGEGQETEAGANDVTEKNGNGTKSRVKYFRVQLQEGDILKARRVVVATGPTRAQMANIPSWVKSIAESYPEERLQHTVHLMHHLSNAKQKLRETNGQTQKEAFLTQGK